MFFSHPHLPLPISLFPISPLSPLPNLPTTTTTTVSRFFQTQSPWVLTSPTSTRGRRGAQPPSPRTLTSASWCSCTSSFLAVLVPASTRYLRSPSILIHSCLCVVMLMARRTRETGARKCVHVCARECAALQLFFLCFQFFRLTHLFHAAASSFNYPQSSSSSSSSSSSPLLLLLPPPFFFCCFAQIVPRRLMMSKIHRPAMSLSRIALNMKGRENLMAVVVGSVVNDPRLIVVRLLLIVARGLGE